MSEMNSTRRQFMKIAATFGSLAILMPSLTQAAEERRKAKPSGGSAPPASGPGAAPGEITDLDLPLVKPGEGMAGSVNYQHSQKNIKDKTLKVERQGVAFDKQHCKACMLYTAVGKKGADEVGKCTLFAGQLVKAEGWCASWSKKA